MNKDKKDLLLKESKSFCTFPWMHIHANPDGQAFPCCVAEQDSINQNLKEKTVDEVFNSDDWKKLRLDMLQGKRNPVCRRCHEVDDSGGFSYRNFANTDFAKFIDLVEETEKDGTIKNPKFKYIDIRFSNTCNFACSTCGAASSTKWIETIKKIKTDVEDRIDMKYLKIEENAKKSIIEQLKPHLPHAEEVYFAGGEPLIMPEHYKVLDLLDENKAYDVRIRYNTNLSTISYKGKKITDIWKNFEQIKLGASIDGVGDVAELIRTGTKWSKIERNMKELLNYENILLNIDTVVSVLNIEYLPEMYTYLFDNNLLNERSWPSLNIAFNPLPYSITSLPRNYKDYYAEKIKNFSKSLEYTDIPLIDTAKEFLIEALEGAVTFMYSKDTFQHEDLVVLNHDSILDKEKFPIVLPNIYKLDQDIQNGRY
jgi:sulfatase maturation enzyme AslB (radical SAM superfamily)